jgi:DNA polymerase (family 10)
VPVHNRDIAEILDKLADLLDIRGENRYRIRAYRNAALTLTGLSQNIAEMVENDEDIRKIPDIGKKISQKVKEIVRTGTLKQLEKIEKQIPSTLSEIMNIPGLGPRKIGVLFKKLNITSIKELQRAAQEAKVQKLRGFGKKTEKNILKEIKRRQKSEEKGNKLRLQYRDAEELTLPVLEYLKKVDGVKDIEAAGSFRRRKETVGDIDILVSCRQGTDIMERFVKYEDVDQVLSKGKTRSSIRLRSGFQIDLRVVQQVSWGAALQYFTGSKEHNVEIRKRAQKKDLKINEYGVFKGKKRAGGKTEKEVFEKVGLPYIQPEIRENRGEIEAAEKKSLPKLITLDDIMGDLQSHTKATDGKSTLKEMTEAAKKRGYEYFAVTDHSKRVTMTKGLDEKRLREQMESIDRLNEKMNGFRILKSVEVDILKDGTLDLSDSALSELDIVIFSIHYNTKLSREQQTKRVLKAMENPHVHILSHPTGRIIGKRGPYDIDIEKIMKGAKETGCFLELNAQPERLDLNEIHCKMAKDMGVKVAISTDAHSLTGLDFMRFGVYQARRGWLEKDEVLNTRPWKQLKKIIKRS